MDLRNVESFLCIYEERSITRAASKLNIVQPALSLQLKKIEDELGVALFDRISRGLKPTKAGDQVYALFQPVMSDFRTAKRRALELRGEKNAQIAVGVTSSTVSGVLTPTLKKYRELTPSVEAQIYESDADSLVDLLAIGRLDLAIVSHAPNRAGIASRFSVDEPIVEVKKRVGDDRVAAPTPFADVIFKHLILPNYRKGYRMLLEQEADRIGVELRPLFEVNSPAAMFDLTSIDNLVAICPLIPAVYGIDRFPIMLSTITAPAFVRQIHVIYREQQAIPPTVAALIDILHEEFQRALDVGAELMA